MLVGREEAAAAEPQLGAGTKEGALAAGRENCESILSSGRRSDGSISHRRRRSEIIRTEREHKQFQTGEERAIVTSQNHH